MRFVAPPFLAAALLMATLPARADIGPGETVVDGIQADITPAGLDFIEVQVPYLSHRVIPCRVMRLVDNEERTV